MFVSSLVVFFVARIDGDDAHYSGIHWLIDEVAPVQLADFAGNITVVDARSGEDYGVDHIPDAVSLSMDEWDAGLTAFLEKWSPDNRIVIYCGGDACQLSKEVAVKLLHDLPDARVAILKGGFPAWVEYTKGTVL